MKRSNILSALMLLVALSVTMIQAACNDCGSCAKTTFIPRRMSQNSVLELALHNYYQYNLPECSECPSWVSIEVTAPYYFKSTNKRELARYFLPNCQEDILIGENNSSDVSSPFLQLITPSGSTFLSRYSIEPSRRVIGGAIKLFFDFSSYIDNCWYSNMWASIFVPVQQVRHDLHVREVPLLAAAGEMPGITDATTALDNPAWLYGKLSPTARRKSGVDDINIKLGLDLIKNDCSHSGLYGQIFIPTGRGPNAEYLFEPLVGSKHVGAGVGINTAWTMLENATSNITFMVDARYAYFFKHRELRSLDLYNGDWSRYLLVVEPTNAGLPLPAINFLTQDVQVTPKSMLEVWAAASLNFCDWHLEVGYDFWYRSQERIELADLNLGVAIADLGYNSTTSCPVSAHCAQICSSIPGEAGAPVSDTTFTPIMNSAAIADLDNCPTNSDCCSTPFNPAQCSYINLDSAAAPKGISNTIYAAVSKDICFCANAAMIGIGGSYEIASRRGTLSQYGIWLKSAISF